MPVPTRAEILKMARRNALVSPDSMMPTDVVAAAPHFSVAASNMLKMPPPSDIIEAAR